MVTTTVDKVAFVRGILEEVTDPEIPVLSIADIGMLRSITFDGHNSVRVTITPTYSGCPAVEMIKEDIVSHLAAAGYRGSVDVTFTPAWTTEWMSPDAKDKLRGYGIAPPGPLGVVEEVLCPNCEADEPRVVSEFGSTACKRLMVCSTCGEPFDQFKAI